RILHWIRRVDAVDLLTLQDYISPDLHGAKGSGGVGREIWTACPGRENDHPAFFEVPDRPAPNEGLGDSTHLDGGDHARDYTVLFERVLQRKGVDDRGQHAHVVGSRAIHSARAGRDPAEDVAPSDDDRGLHPATLDFPDHER